MDQQQFSTHTGQDVSTLHISLGANALKNSKWLWSYTLFQFQLCCSSHFLNAFQWFSNYIWHRNQIIGIMMPNHTIFNCLTPMETVMQKQYYIIICRTQLCHLPITSIAQPSLTLGKCAATFHMLTIIRLCLKCDGTCAQTRLRFSAKWTSPFKSAGVSVQPTTGSRGARISGSNVGYTTFWGSVKSTGYPLHSPVSPSFPILCIVCHHITVTTFFLYMIIPGMGQDQ